MQQDLLSCIVRWECLDLLEDTILLHLDLQDLEDLQVDIMHQDLRCDLLFTMEEEDHLQEEWVNNNQEDLITLIPWQEEDHLQVIIQGVL